MHTVLDSKDNSMPSGHTSNSFATATSLTLMFKSKVLAVSAFVWAGAVGYSRMRLGMHYPTDVLAGAALGIASSLISFHVNKVLKKHCDKRTKRTCLSKFCF